ncbi:MAG TPA: flagellar protein FliS [Anaerolineales bacterium]|nr:flagellar protein FliS [Anaerolineales bacterium]HNN13107.1 flagellar protein FliS [Anaerolineales bacterium]
MYQSVYRNQYQQQDVLSASPLRLVIMTYDLAIRSCEQQDFGKAIKTISALRDALDLDYPEVAVGLFRLYQWCLDSIRRGDYTSAINTLTELRSAWVATEENIAARANSTFSATPKYATSFGNVLT